MARAAGLPPAVPYPVAARGALRLDAQRAQVRLDHVRAGRSYGSGEVSYPLGGPGTPRLRLALATLDLDEPAAKHAKEERGAAPRGPGLPRPAPRPPDAEFELTAGRIAYGSARLSDFRLEGAVRAGGVRAAPFAIRWEGLAVRGHLDIDLGGDRPWIGIEAAAHDADLRPLLDLIGADQLEVRAAKLSVSARAAGERLHELLGSATVDAALQGARIALPRPLLIGAKGHGAIDATFGAAPGRPTVLAARGELDERPLELSAEGPPLDALEAGEGGWPLALRGRLGDLRIEADGTVDRAGADARVRIEGDRLDQLGRRLGLALPEAAPYAASARLRLAPESADVSDLQASFGSSRIAGRLHTDWRAGRRPLHRATLHSPRLHLEDIGAGGWARERGPGVPVDGLAQPLGEVVEQLMALLPRADVEASIEVDALLGGGQKFASGEIRVNLANGALHARLREVQAQDGSGNAELRVDAAASPPRFGLRADVRGVEYGALSRAMRPGSPLNGTVDLVADLSAQAPPAGLLTAACSLSPWATAWRAATASSSRRPRCASSATWRSGSAAGRWPAGSIRARTDALRLAAGPVLQRLAAPRGPPRPGSGRLPGGVRPRARSAPGAGAGPLAPGAALQPGPRARRPVARCGPMRQLSKNDALFLGSDSAHSSSHISLVQIYDPSTAPGGRLRFKDFLALVESRLHRSHVFRHKLRNVPFGLDEPYWIEDENFDLEYHVRNIALPKPGDWRQFCIQSSRIHARPLDLNRPLWEIYVIEGLDAIDELPKDSFALLTKLHNAAIDVKRGTAIITLLHDTVPRPARPEPRRARWSWPAAAWPAPSPRRSGWSARCGTP